MEMEHMKEKCGVFGCVANGDKLSNADVSLMISMGMMGLQHRGQESAGIVTSTGKKSEPLLHHRGMGMVSQVFDDETLGKLAGALGIGHTRYSTVGGSERANCQPFIVETTYGQFAVAHNGELVNSLSLKREILRNGIGLSTGSDSEVMTQILCSTPECGEPVDINWVARIKHLMQRTSTSYSLLILYKDRIYAVRDPYGNRPLCLGFVGDAVRTRFFVNGNGAIPVTNGDGPHVSDDENGKVDSPISLRLNGVMVEDHAEHLGYVVSSESCPFNSIGCRLYREVLPGEIVEVSKTGFKSMGIVYRPQGEPSAMCIFEYVYFARADSYIEGQQVYSVRLRCGRELAYESPVVADMVSVIPESATAAALGYSQASGIPFMEVLSRNRYVGRTFIQPSTYLRQIGVANKFGVLEENFRGKRIVMIDDSIVRGNTVGPIVRMLRQHGATEVHIRIASPPIKYPCFMGINIPTREELIANSLNPTQLAKYVGADSLCYLSVDGLHKAVEAALTLKEVRNIGHCNACLTGKYPVPIEF